MTPLGVVTGDHSRKMFEYGCSAIRECASMGVCLNVVVQHFGSFMTIRDIGLL